MNYNNINDIINLIARRDGISYEEAKFCVDDCIEELRYIINSGGYGMYQEAEDAIASILGLEPDYLDIILNEI